MNNQDFKGLVSALEKVSGEQKRVTDLLLEKLQIVTDGVMDVLKEHELTDDLKRFDYQGFGFRYCTSNIGGVYWFVRGYAENDYDLNYGFKLLPTTTKRINTDVFLHGDFHAKYDFMTRQDILDTCKILPEFIQNVIGKIQSLTDKEKQFLNQFQNTEWTNN